MSDPSALEGPVHRWSRWQLALLSALILLGFWLRLRGLSLEGFADDEIHKWLAANRYLHGDFGGDDIEHPMLMKSLITLALLVGRPFGWAPETITRLPNVLAGSATIWAVAALGRRLFGRSVGLTAAALAAVSTTLIGYQRVAKEDTLLGFFLILLLLFLGGAKAAADDGRAHDQARNEVLCAVALGMMLASKYFLFFAPIPVLAYLWLLPTTRWRISWKRWGVLLAVAFCTFALLDWTPFLPSSWRYGLDYMAEKKTVSGSLFFMGRLYHNLPSWWLDGTPPWFYVVFFGVKFGPLTVAFALIGLVLALWRRAPSQRVLLAWMGWWMLILGASGSKWGRFTLSVTPAFLLCAADGILETVRALGRSAWTRVAVPATALLVASLELRTALVHFPHYRLYVNALGGGDDRVDWYFPHCDYFDAGLREAMAHVARAAEPNAEVTSEVDWPARYYLDRFGRPDLSATLLRPGIACAAKKHCYVVVQTGRLYFANQAALSNLAKHTPWYVEPVDGRPVVKVYRLEPQENPFPSD